MNKDRVFEIVKKNILELLKELNPEYITPQASMRNLGANSIDRVDVIIGSLEALSLKIPLTELAKLQNIGELVDFLYEKWKIKNRVFNENPT